ncbi:hypothetical protein Ddye_018889 [Dipteronia dyeriana]|uniref:Uncharacterized protein n=1 Tax=Dipteronia dyeriana TaxID=168575 RepID=A0AAD9WTX1_9ROSI|nr:hypothetical protein Ddye_018889 [Dipteronia dyeriana]
MQVCMCGKCKQSRVVDVDVVHDGCKCMGKCKKGPNSKLYNFVDDTPANPLFSGVRLEDVNGVVANSLAQQNTTITNDLGLNLFVPPYFECRVDEEEDHSQNHKEEKDDWRIDIPDEDVDYYNDTKKQNEDKEQGKDNKGDKEVKK